MFLGFIPALIYIFCNISKISFANIIRSPFVVRTLLIEFLLLFVYVFFIYKPPINFNRESMLFDKENNSQSSTKNLTAFNFDKASHVYIKGNTLKGFDSIINASNSDHINVENNDMSK